MAAKAGTARRHTVKRRPVTRASRFVMRVNVLLTQEQYVKLQEWARNDGRTLPNLIRRLFDLAIAGRPLAAAPRGAVRKSA